MVKIENGVVTFSSGRYRHANCGIIGLGPNLDEITEGYDATFYNVGETPLLPEDEPFTLTAADAIELADHMIGQWQAFKRQMEAKL